MQSLGGGLDTSVRGWCVPHVGLEGKNRVEEADGPEVIVGVGRAGELARARQLVYTRPERDPSRLVF